MSQLELATSDPPKFSSKELLSLERYDKMVTAVAECQQVDEIKDIRDKAEALEKYARAAKHYQSELRAMDIRLRASVRAGALIAEGQKDGTIAKQGGGDFNRKATSPSPRLLSADEKPKTLVQLGISHDQSSQWKQLAGIKSEDLEEQLPVRTGKRTSPEKIIRATKPKLDPALLHRKRMTTLALRIWGGVRDVSDLAEGESLREIVGAMDRQLVDGLKKSIPKAIKFLEALEKELRNAKPQK